MYLQAVIKEVNLENNDEMSQFIAEKLFMNDDRKSWSKSGAAQIDYLSNSNIDKSDEHEFIESPRHSSYVSDERSRASSIAVRDLFK